MKNYNNSIIGNEHFWLWAQHARQDTIMSCVSWRVKWIQRLKLLWILFREFSIPSPHRSGFSGLMWWALYDAARPAAHIVSKALTASTTVGDGGRLNLLSRVSVVACKTHTVRFQFSPVTYTLSRKKNSHETSVVGYRGWTFYTHVYRKNCTNPVRDNYNLKWHKYVCITNYQPDTKSNHNPNPNPNLTT